MVDNLIKDPSFLAKIKDISKKENRAFQEVEEEALAYLKELYTERNEVSKVIGYELMQAIISRGYERKIDVNPAEIKELAKLMRRYSVAFVITHKTYIDPIVLTMALARYGMPWPYIFGGINMSFVGAKQLGKQTGAIFIRRSFKNNEVYKACLRHYIAFLIDKGEHFNWAIEGTRSRTGKIVWPKMGILKYILEGEQQSHSEVKYVPVSIVYDLIPDVKAMTEEGKGKDKKPESLKWFMNYAKQMGEHHGKIAIRFGEPVQLESDHSAIIPGMEEKTQAEANKLPRFAFELVHKINQISPVTTVSLVCTSLLSHFSLTKKELVNKVGQLMHFIEKRKQDVLLDRNIPIGESVQKAINLLLKTGIVLKTQSGLNAQYYISENEYLRANYYSNMVANYFYHRAFIELALLKTATDDAPDKMLAFWKKIMVLRDLFKFEFFYTNRAEFSDEIEAELNNMSPDWQTLIKKGNRGINQLLRKQNISVAESMLLTYIEAYKVCLETLLMWDKEVSFSRQGFIEACVFKGKEMHWQGKIRKLDSLSKPFLDNGLRLIQNKKFSHNPSPEILQSMRDCLANLHAVSDCFTRLQKLNVAPAIPEEPMANEPDMVPGDDLKVLSESTLESEEYGKHIAAFFDLDRTLINDFSVKQFFKARLLSGQMTTRELSAQLLGFLMYKTNDEDFASMAAMGAKGVIGESEHIFEELGEQIYLEHLAHAIYPEARAMVLSHLEKGHTVAVVSAATPYQVNPIARDLGIDHVLCTKLEVIEGKITGNIAVSCWGDGKATEAQAFSEPRKIDLNKSYFYTDSYEDLPLLQAVGNPVAINPDKKLSQLAFENNWPIHRFKDQATTPLTDSIRTGLALWSFYPSVVRGLLTGGLTMSTRNGINATIETVGDLGSMLAGIELIIKGKEYLVNRPAVFLFNHQSSSELFILAKVLRKDVRPVAKKELAYHPLGPLFKATGFVFVDRANKEKAIEALKPAVDALKEGTSIVIAPEGTRSSSKKLGKFKKGAFHMAMQGGVPIIPIIMKNSHDVMPKGSSMFHPTQVEVVVSAPIDVSKWDVKNLDVHIEEVRNIYLKELEQTP